MSAAALQTHLDGGVTTVCRCWHVRRGDGVNLGFTDHDRSLNFDGITFRADSGLTAQAMEAGTGLAVDNAEAIGLLSDDAIRARDLSEGRFDGAAVTVWAVNWADVAQRTILFHGTIGEVTASGGMFRAELRGASETLNRVRGNLFQRTCNADLGDAACTVDLSNPAFSGEATILHGPLGAAFRVAADQAYPDEWFLRGQVQVLTGDARGLSAFVKADTLEGGERALALWEPFRAPLAPGDRVRLVAGCDKRLQTCRDKFANLLNFRGFPHIPGEDWTMAYPKSSGRNSGGSLQ